MNIDEWYAADCPPDWAICHYRETDDAPECDTLATYLITARDAEGTFEAGACDEHTAVARRVAEPGEILTIRNYRQPARSTQ